MTHWDAIIIGAGYAGSFAAGLLAGRGHRVLLLEKQEAFPDLPADLQMIEIDTFAKTGLPRSGEEEFIAHISTYNMYSPHTHIKRSIPFSSLMVHGGRLKARLRELARAAGAEVRSEEVSALSLAGERVSGVETAQGHAYEGQLIIDASGVNSGLRQQLPQSWDVAAALPLHKTAIVYRQLCSSHMPGDELDIYFCMQRGYIWRSALDIGLGVIATKDLDPQATVAAFAAKHNWQPGPVQASFQGLIPIQPPLPNLVGAGFAVVGDTAAMVNTMRGGGITPALRGARLLSEAAHEALSSGGPVSAESLWPYNLTYQRQVGIQLAYQNALRAGVLDLELKDIEFSFSHDLITADDLGKSLVGQLITFSPWEKIQKGLKGASHPGLLLQYDRCLEHARLIYLHYQAYPADPAEFEPWHQKLNNLQKMVGTL